MNPRCDILLVAAFPPELAALRPALGDALRGTLGGLDVAARAVGIGLVASPAGPAACIAEERPRAVVLLGTCGVYRRAPIAALDVAIARAIHLVDPAVAEGRAAFPEPMGVSLAPDGGLVDGLLAAGGKGARLGATLAVTTDDALAGVLARDADVEHLEAFGVAAACASAGVPFAAALGVANVVGSRGRAEWRAQHHEASDAAVRLVLSWLGGGAGGLPTR